MAERATRLCRETVAVVMDLACVTLSHSGAAPAELTQSATGTGVQ
jgi:hypothetical protein